MILKSLNFSSAPVDNYKPNDEKRNLSLQKLLTEHAPEQLGLKQDYIQEHQPGH